MIASSERRQQGSKILGQRRLRFDPAPVLGVRKGQSASVQSLATEAAQGRDQCFRRSRRQPQATTVQGIANDRQAHVCQVHTNLVGATSLKTTAQQGVSGIAGFDSRVGHRWTSVVHHRAAQPVGRVSIQWGVNGEAADWLALHQGQVLALDLPTSERLAQRLVAAGRSRHQQGTTGVLVQAVHDAGPRQPRQDWIERQQGVDQRATAVAGTGMHDQASRLVDHHQRFVLIQLVQRDGLGLIRCLDALTGFQLDPFATSHALARPAGFAVYLDRPVLYPAPQLGTGKLRPQLGQAGIQPQSGALAWQHAITTDRLQCRFGLIRQIWHLRLPSAQIADSLTLAAGSMHGDSCGMQPHRLRFAVRYPYVQSMMRLRTLLLMLLLLAATGCSLFGDKNRFDAEADVMSVEQLYDEANAAMQDGGFERAIRFYRALIARFPFGSYSEQAQLDLAYCQYRRDQDDEAVATLNRFLKAHPTHPKVDYALFLRGLVNFDRNASMLDRVMPNEIATRDQQSLRQAFIDFSELIKRYPSSAYAGDARQRMVYLRNSMAEFEMNVARYYYRRGAYVAAATRAAFVVENYQRTPQSLDALELMASSYEHLGEPAMAEDVRRVLSLTAPEREQAIEEKAPWWRRWLPFG